MPKIRNRPPFTVPAGLNESSQRRAGPACISHQLTAEALDRPAHTALRSFAVLTVPRQYDYARQTARASY